MLRYCLARVRNQGYGLGNELVPWARAFLAATVLGARLLPPAFGLNRREYWRHFRTPPDDWIYNRAIERLLPSIHFGEADYLQHGGDDVVAALRSFARAHALHRRHAYVLVTEGLWGGFYHVQAARDFMRATLYQSRFAARNLLQLRERIDPEKILIGMHVRLGDFRPAVAASEHHRVANVSLPLEWFCNVADSLRAALGDALQFLVVSDGTADQLRPLMQRVDCITTADQPDADCSDALALADSDLLVCSASTYSHLAAFLSDSPYVWFAPNLHRHAEGCYSLGNPDADLARAGSPRARALREFTAHRGDWPSRGFAVDMDGAVSAELVELLRERHARRRWQADPLRGGLIKTPARR
ncbi:MAG TPA: hypothetical protein VKT19_05175 [Steroidobacteraceae bacterium]|nr:hypothetical protein [Steroidobacteraceae bacterium]